MTIIKQKIFVATDAKTNSNKFYEISLKQDGSIVTRHGRVGAAGVSNDVVDEFGEEGFNRLVAKRSSRGKYKEVSVLAETSAENVANVSKDLLKKTAVKEMLDESLTENEKSVVQKLLEQLADINRHNIVTASGGQITVSTDGLVRTPLGLVTKNSLKEAKDVLKKLEKLYLKKDFKNQAYVENLETYLNKIPQKVGSRQGWHLTFFDDKPFSKQYDLIEQLESAVDEYEERKSQAQKSASDAQPSDNVFETKIKLVTDKAVLKEIENFYKSNINSKHASSSFKLVKVYELSNENWTKAFEGPKTKLGNIKRLWHGTRAHNVLSILKHGLFVPKGGGTYTIQGRMFGDGIYFSDQSSKSLNYSYGYWDNQAKDNTCFMFLADVAMGKEYTPTGPTRLLPKGFDSIFAEGKKSGVLNNEMIVPHKEQQNLRYLCEFSLK